MSNFKLQHRVIAYYSISSVTVANLNTTTKHDSYFYRYRLFSHAKLLHAFNCVIKLTIFFLKLRQKYFRCKKKSLLPPKPSCVNDYKRTVKPRIIPLALCLVFFFSLHFTPQITQHCHFFLSLELFRAEFLRTRSHRDVASGPSGEQLGNEYKRRHTTPRRPHITSLHAPVCVQCIRFDSMCNFIYSPILSYIYQNSKYTQNINKYTYYI